MHPCGLPSAVVDMTTLLFLIRDLTTTAVSLAPFALFVQSTCIPSMHACHLAHLIAQRSWAGACWPTAFSPPACYAQQRALNTYRVTEQGADLLLSHVHTPLAQFQPGALFTYPLSLTCCHPWRFTARSECCTCCTCCTVSSQLVVSPPPLPRSRAPVSLSSTRRPVAAMEG